MRKVFLDEKLRLARCVAAPAADFKRKGGAGVSALTAGIVTAHFLKEVHLHLVYADCAAPRRAAVGRYWGLVLELHVTVNASLACSQSSLSTCIVCHEQVRVR